VPIFNDKISSAATSRSIARGAAARRSTVRCSAARRRIDANGAAPFSGKFGPGTDEGRCTPSI
jgi:exo-beta-1,3-glucanase (GH17 family)